MRLGWRPPRGDWLGLAPVAHARGGVAATIRDPRIVDDWLRTRGERPGGVTILDMMSAMRWPNIHAVARAVRLLFEFFPEDTRPLAAPLCPPHAIGETQRLACHPILLWHLRRMLCVLDAVAARWDGRTVLHDLDMEVDVLRRRRRGECVMYIARHHRVLTV